MGNVWTGTGLWIFGPTGCRLDGPLNDRVVDVVAPDNPGPQVG